MRNSNWLFLPILLFLSAFVHAGDLSNPYMKPIKINIQTCINQNMKDCLKSICMASPEACQAQCAANSSDKCKLLSGQNVYSE
ncbi:hypothetical protein [Legionella shakespearei]|uniref:Uncharacterized protein n=1 Tax=Legionella shakespearei DSM 23087 TaxID=1122169 RepID=A0A0W0Z276_9GAMM|nr:hypothetical protein [Legionella shakespearei]KTD63212.1 hypothetical protein Lsha_0764 [Legionella shakespearei DSM 23087]